MVFSNLFFIYLFLPLNLILYFISSNKTWRNGVLLAFSLFFYAWGEPLCVFILIISAALNYILAFAIDKYRGKLMGKLAVFFAVFFDLAVLGIFKYSGFIAENLNALLPLNLPVPDIKLPIGISFYTFQIISYVIDCHWEKVSVQKSTEEKRGCKNRFWDFWHTFQCFRSLSQDLLCGTVLLKVR